jgi:CRP-like cAMP-binding protein
MEKYHAVLKQSPLFKDIDSADLTALLSCLSALKRSAGKNEFIFSAGEAAVYVGIVLSGSVNVIQEDFWGNRTILTHVTPGELFGEAFACAPVPNLPVSVIAAEKSEILLIDANRIITTCPAACTFHARLIANMLEILSMKNINLIQKIEHITKRTTREKLLSYLSEQARKAKNPSFDIPFNRQELADYLSVDRSAMSAELSKMQEEGILRYKRNHFELKCSKKI